MVRRELNTLIIGDDDLDCKKEDTSLDNLTLLDTAFNYTDLEPFDLVVYSGEKGTKILKSRAFKTGKVI